VDSAAALEDSAAAEGSAVSVEDEAEVAAVARDGKSRSST
jgi:hypothetical protein